MKKEWSKNMFDKKKDGIEVKVELWLLKKNIEFRG